MAAHIVECTDLMILPQHNKERDASYIEDVVVTGSFEAAAMTGVKPSPGQESTLLELEQSFIGQFFLSHWHALFYVVCCRGDASGTPNEPMKRGC